MSKLRLMVCPHDTASNPERWYLFAQHLSQALEAEVRFEPAVDFKGFHERLDEADIVYASPKDVINRLLPRGYAPVARPAEIYDEVVFIAAPQVESPALSSLAGEPVATVLSMLPTNIGLSILRRNDVEPGELVDRDSWFSVINCVRRGTTRFGFLYKDTYDELSGLSKSMFKAFETSSERVAFHSLCAAGSLNGQRERLSLAVAGMHQDPRARTVLDKLGIRQWLAVTEEEMAAVRRIVEM